jgi:hypothetical protein
MPTPPRTNPTGGSEAVLKKGTVVVPGMDWKLSVDSNLKDVANFADGRHQKITMLDADFSATILFDANSMPHDPAGFGFMPGAEWTADCYVTATQFFSVPIVIGKMEFNSKIDDVVTYSMDGKLNGAITWPVIGTPGP